MIVGSTSMRPNMNHSNGFDMSEANRNKVALLPDDIIEKYKEAISHYAKVSYFPLAFTSFCPPHNHYVNLLIPMDARSTSQTCYSKIRCIIWVLESKGPFTLSVSIKCQQMALDVDAQMGMEPNQLSG